MPKIQPPFVRAPGNYDPTAACEECCVQDFGPSLTQQSQREEADINTIVRRFGLTQQLPPNLRPAVYQDFENVFDFHSAMNAVAGANSMFMKMPPAIRARFDNDPGKFVEYASDPKNIDALREIGLAVPKTIENAPAGAPGNQPTGPKPTDGGNDGKDP